jgi:hypothetical protein
MEITFDTANNRIIVTRDGVEFIYYRADKEKYVSDIGRLEDVIAMGW